MTFFFNIFNLNSTIVIMTGPKHLLKAVEVPTCRNRVETALYMIQRSNLLTEFFLFHNPRQSKTGIILS